MRRVDHLSGLEMLLARKSVGRILRKFLRPPNLTTRLLDVGQAYGLWAPTYAEETLPRYLDDKLGREIRVSRISVLAVTH